MAIERFESNTGLQADQAVSAALFSEYAQLTAQDRNLKHNREVAKLAEGQDGAKPGTDLSKTTPAESAAKAFETFASTGKLTPELKKQFEDAIAGADKGPSPKIPALEKQVADLQKEFERVYPQATRDEVKKLDKEIEDSFKKLPQDKQEEFAMLLQFRGLVSDADRQKIDERLKQIAPDIVDKINKIEQLQAPAAAVVEKLQEASEALALEKNQDSITRLLYGIALLQSGDRDGAKKQIADAATKNPSLLDSADFVQLARELGIDVDSLKKSAPKK
ncbi:MAG TPA: hypothetical protein V6D08_02285 [Candidatus Obscuribacterales bacterium]